jgi:mevalonate kinase
MRVDENEALGRVGSVFGDLLGQDPFGGEGAGTYVFADLAELDLVASQWRAEREKIQKRDEKILDAIHLIAPPAEDLMSTGQAEAFRSSLEKLKDHNQALLDYANGYIDKLAEVRDSYTASEDTNTARMKNHGSGA